MIYDELTGEVIENPDLTKGKVYTKEKLLDTKKLNGFFLKVV
mgnify:CR=1 FL=1